MHSVAISMKVKCSRGHLAFNQLCQTCQCNLEGLVRFTGLSRDVIQFGLHRLKQNSLELSRIRVVVHFSGAMFLELVLLCLLFNMLILMHIWWMIRTTLPTRVTVSSTHCQTPKPKAMPECLRNRYPMQDSGTTTTKSSEDGGSSSSAQRFLPEYVHILTSSGRAYHTQIDCPYLCKGKSQSYFNCSYCSKHLDLGLKQS